MITNAAAAWAIVVWTGVCVPGHQPNTACVGQLASGLVWGSPAKCEEELRKNPLPGAECREILSVEDPDPTGDGPDSMENVLQDLNTEAKRL